MYRTKPPAGTMERAVVTTLPVSSWREFKELRLRALRSDPQAFGRSYEEESCYPDETWRQELMDSESGRCHLFFARLHGALVGMVKGGRTDEDRFGHSAYVVSMYVDAPARGRGIAKELMGRALEALAGEEDVRVVRLYVNSGQGPAIRLYEGLGFREVGRSRWRMADGLEHDEKVMQKRLR